MISKAKVKYIKSLQVKKYRNQEQCFLVEGAKSVKEILHSDYEVIMIAGSIDFLSNGSLQSNSTFEIIECTEQELSSVGSFQTNEAAIAVAKMKPNIPPSTTKHELILALDDIRDPGNLGTIIRTADWYGIKSIVASEHTADCYNPKVITASMGSFSRVNVFYTDLTRWIHDENKFVYGAFLDGKDVHSLDIDKGAVIVIGNESRGISKEVEMFIQHKITIPRIGQAESLNAGVATAIILDNIRRLQK